MNRDILQSVFSFFSRVQLIRFRCISRLFKSVAECELRHRGIDERFLQLIKAKEIFNVKTKLSICAAKEAQTIDHFMVTGRFVFDLRDNNPIVLKLSSRLQKLHNFYYQIDGEKSVVYYLDLQPKSEHLLEKKKAIFPGTPDVEISLPSDIWISNYREKSVAVHYEDNIIIVRATGSQVLKSVEARNLELEHSTFVGRWLFLKYSIATKVVDVEKDELKVSYSTIYYLGKHLVNFDNYYYFYNDLEKVIVIIDVESNRTRMFYRCQQPKYSPSGIIYGLSNEMQIYLIFGFKIKHFSLPVIAFHVYLSGPFFKLYGGSSEHLFVAKS